MMVVGLPNSGKSSLINALKLAAKKQGNMAVGCHCLTCPACLLLSGRKQRNTAMAACLSSSLCIYRLCMQVDMREHRAMSESIAVPCCANSTDQ